MSNDIYNRLCETVLPNNLTPTERLLLFHLAHRHNEKKGYAYPPESELAHVLGVTVGCVRKCRSKLRKKGLIKQIKIGYRGQQAEDAVTVDHLPRLKGTPTDTLSNNNGYVEKLERVSNENVKGVGSALKGYVHEHPKQTTNTTNSNNEGEGFRNLLTLLPIEKRFSFDKNINERLQELERRGISFNVIKANLGLVNWAEINAPAGFLSKRLADLVASTPRWSSDHVPAWCGLCNEATRHTDEPEAIYGGNGATTRQCQRCHYISVNKREAQRDPSDPYGSS